MRLFLIKSFKVVSKEGKLYNPLLPRDVLQKTGRPKPIESSWWIGKETDIRYWPTKWKILTRISNRLKLEEL